MAAPSPSPPSPSPPSPSPAPATAADPQIAAAREAWIGYGYPAEAFDQALSGSEPTPEPAAAEHKIVGLGQVDLAYAGGLADALLRAGVPADEVAAAAAADGLTYTPPAADDRSPAEQEFDAMFAAPAVPSDYEIDYSTLPQMDAAELVKLDADAKAALHAARFPRQIGGAVLEFVMQDASHYERMSDESRVVYDVGERHELARLVEGDVGEAVKNAATVLSIMRDAKPELVKDLLDRGAFRSARVIAQLANHAQRLAERGELEARRKGPAR